jgi:choline dehydrogenase-like flavoprotein
MQIRSDAEGEVKSGFGGRDRVVYSLTERDMMKARKGLAYVATMMLEQGATEIWPGVFGLPPVMTTVDEARKIENASLDPRAYGFIATHLFGAARMGIDAKTSVVDSGFESHEAKGLFVVDSSIFPTNLGVNPQHSIMAVARLAATRIAERAAHFRMPHAASSVSA